MLILFPYIVSQPLFRGEQGRYSAEREGSFRVRLNGRCTGFKAAISKCCLHGTWEPCMGQDILQGRLEGASIAGVMQTACWLDFYSIRRACPALIKYLSVPPFC